MSMLVSNLQTRQLESHLNALGFSFPIYTMEIIKVPTHEVVIRMS